MYVANRKMKVSTDGKMIHYLAGDIIPDFEDWSEVSKRANLNLDWVRKVDGDAPKKAASKPVETKQKGADLTTGFGCQICPKSFKSAKGLKAHTTLSHTKKEA